jgi:hypothetical protein
MCCGAMENNEGRATADPIAVACLSVKEEIAAIATIYNSTFMYT